MKLKSISDHVEQINNDIDENIAKTKIKFAILKDTLNSKFNILENEQNYKFEYAKKNNRFPYRFMEINVPYSTSGNYLVKTEDSWSYTNQPEWAGYWAIGDKNYGLQISMMKEPNFIVKYMNKLFFGFTWVSTNKK